MHAPTPPFQLSTIQPFNHSPAKPSTINHQPSTLPRRSLNPTIVTPHPVGQQEVGAVVLQVPRPAAVGSVGIAVPPRHRPLVGRGHLAQLPAAVPVDIPAKVHIDPVGIPD